MTMMNGNDHERQAANGPDELERNVRLRCNAQIPVDEIAAMYSQSVEALEERFGKRLEQWRKEGKGQARQELFWAACSGKISALIFFLKSYCGLGCPVPQIEPENPVANYTVKVRNMSDQELGEELEQRRGACGAHERIAIGSGGGGGETPRSSELA